MSDNNLLAKNWQRAVLKIGSNLIAPDGACLSVQYVLGLAQFVAQARAQGREVIVVSSGAVAAGRAAMRGLQTSAVQNANPQNKSITAKQALAAIGQAQLIKFWQQFFDAPVAQLLLTLDDLLNRRRFVNAKNTLRELLALNVIPIINENDSVAVDELRVGDNDNLAAQVAVLVDADLLIIATDIDGLFDADPRTNTDARLIRCVDRVDEQVLALAGGAGSAVGTGGMRTKLQAARKTAERGIATVIVNGRQAGALNALLHTELFSPVLTGTWFRPHDSLLSAKKHWLLHVLPALGQIEIDAGAMTAVQMRGASLLPSGIVVVQGDFHEGDCIAIVHQQKLLGKGIALYEADAVRRLLGARSSDIESRLGYSNGECVVHRDDLVLID